MRLLLSSLLALTLATPALAQQRHNSDAPIDFGADHIELQDKANRAILTGNVSVKQAEMTLTAARMTVAYTGQVVDGSPQVSRLDAAGNVVVTRPDQTARSQYAIYDLNQRTILMMGNVTLTQGGNVTHSQRLTLNLAEAQPHATLGGGRVTGTFSVPKRN
ncbi:LptA/OstA family protein [Sphingomonas sp. H39-1-10]|uniref:LptA/OstA family protein n=1 Tax=Sphingomonas TaxID=13687 RepID=UPI000887EE21|nr:MULTISPECIES: LptA/OstA family protein [Sphingomonas]MDF0487082.1 LptA/OstA family protein [Sphingomonas pollutisoli]SDA26478.1 lipopolysaccharide export system protein LptA [Sphingomonas sp. NFR15]